MARIGLISIPKPGKEITEKSLGFIGFLLCGVNDGQAAALGPDHLADKLAYLLRFNGAVKLRETEIVEIGHIIGAKPETGGIKAIQIPDAAAHSAAL